MYRKLISEHLTQFSGEFFAICLFQLGNMSHRFRTQDVDSPVMAELIVSVIGPNTSTSLARAPLTS